MYSHQPSNYVCPYCRFLAGFEDETTLCKHTDLVYESAEVVAFIANKWWTNNPGHVLVIPRAHYENLYVLPDLCLFEIGKVIKLIAVAMKNAYKCEGTSTRQHNEPAGYQHVWHYHHHVFPRWEGDRLYSSSGSFAAPEKRAPYAVKLKAALKEMTV